MHGVWSESMVRVWFKSVVRVLSDSCPWFSHVESSYVCVPMTVVMLLMSFDTLHLHTCYLSRY